MDKLNIDNIRLIYSYILYMVPIVVLFLIGFFLGKKLLFSENYKKIRITGSIFQKTFQFIIRLIAVLLTAAILAIITGIVLLLIALFTGIYILW